VHWKYIIQHIQNDWKNRFFSYHCARVSSHRRKQRYSITKVHLLWTNNKNTGLVYIVRINSYTDFSLDDAIHWYMSNHTKDSERRRSAILKIHHGIGHRPGNTKKSLTAPKTILSRPFPHHHAQNRITNQRSHSPRSIIRHTKIVATTSKATPIQGKRGIPKLIPGFRCAWIRCVGQTKSRETKSHLVSKSHTTKKRTKPRQVRHKWVWQQDQNTQHAWYRLVIIMTAYAKKGKRRETTTHSAHEIYAAVFKTDSNDFADPYSWDDEPILPAITPNHHLGVIKATLRAKTRPERINAINNTVYITNETKDKNCNSIIRISKHIARDF